MLMSSRLGVLCENRIINLNAVAVLVRICDIMPLLLGFAPYSMVFIWCRSICAQSTTWRTNSSNGVSTHVTPLMRHMTATAKKREAAEADSVCSVHSSKYQCPIVLLRRFPVPSSKSACVTAEKITDQQLAPVHEIMCLLGVFAGAV